jgi:hypothetical protein
MAPAGTPAPRGLTEAERCRDAVVSHQRLRAGTACLALA